MRHEDISYMITMDITFWSWLVLHHGSSQVMIHSSGPIGRPSTIAFDDINKVGGNNSLGLFARMQLIIPQKGVLVRQRRAICACEIAMVDEARHIVRLRAIEVLSRIVVDIIEQSIHIIQREVSAGVSLRNLDGEWCSVLVDGVDGDDLLEHLRRNLCQIVRLVWPVLIRSDTSCFW